MILRKEQFKKTAFALSLILMIIWLIMGTGTSLAWFTDTSDEVRNIINFGSFDLKVSYKDGDSYKPLDSQQAVFDDSALYEPGYTQVVRLRVENDGTIPFEYKTAVSVFRYTTPVNVYGQPFLLQDYLRFRVVTASSEAELETLLADRCSAREPSQPLNNYYSENGTYVGTEDNNKYSYAAIVVFMPEEVGNAANYRGTPEPCVELNIVLTAEQITN